MYQGPRIVGAALMATGFLMLVIAVVLAIVSIDYLNLAFAVIGFGVLLLLAGAFLATGCLTKLKTTAFGKFGLEAEFERLPKIAQRELPSEIRQQRETHAGALPVPGRDAPAFNLVEAALALDATPCADPLVPMYLLDKD